jgi:gamma-glutamyltranspeptidase/glutathione hydrolase
VNRKTGGGGFLLYREAKSGKVWAIDFRERAPLKAHEKMFLDEKGNVIPDKSTAGTFSVGVPGLVMGMMELLVCTYHTATDHSIGR